MENSIITEYAALEGIHKDYRVQLLALLKTALRVTPCAWVMKWSPTACGSKGYEVETGLGRTVQITQFEEMSAGLEAGRLSSNQV